MPGNNSATDGNTVITPTADLSILKGNGVGSVTPGTPVTYAITVANAGPSGVTGATVTDVFPAAMTGVTWTCSASGGAACPASGSGDISASVDLPSGSSVLFTATGTVSGGATGTLSNTATVVAPGGFNDPAGNNSATDADPLTPEADLDISKTGPATAIAGTNVSYTVVVTNAGPSDAVATSVSDPTPTGLTFVSNTGDCVTAYPCALGTLPAGATRTITTTYAIPPAYTTPDPIVNIATVSSATPDPSAGNNTASA
ncbi:MAG: DUF11 domain-containing protein, partial [Gemmatimonadetes bacterium]|nr:DUF11 domain-containing protein [Gemmatimonadota bacterium]